MIEINKNKTKSIRRIILAAVCAVLALIFIIGSVSIVPEGYTGNTYRFGELVNTDTGTGLRVHAPVIETIKRVDLRAQVYAVSLSCYTKDTQVVENLPVKLTYQYDRANWTIWYATSASTMSPLRSSTLTYPVS